MLLVKCIGKSTELPVHTLESMYSHRALQFSERLAWEVSVDRFGMEIDQYDTLDPTYVVICNADGIHLASMRLLPMNTPNMLFDHFHDMLPADFLFDVNDLECTRFCLNPELKGTEALACLRTLFVACVTHGLNNGVKFGFGVYDENMRRIYARIGWEPKAISIGMGERSGLMIGKWIVCQKILDNLKSKNEPTIEMNIDELVFRNSISSESI